MKVHSWKSITEAIGMASVSVLLGVYLASHSADLGIQMMLLSFPPASLWLAVRRNRPVSEPNFTELASVENRDLAPVVAVAQALEVERLVQAS